MFPFLPFFCSYLRDNPALATIEPGAFEGMTGYSLYVCFAAPGQCVGYAGSFLAPEHGGTIVLRTWLFGARGSGVASGRAVARFSLGGVPWCAASGPAARPCGLLSGVAEHAGFACAPRPLFFCSYLKDNPRLVTIQPGVFEGVQCLNLCVCAILVGATVGW